MLSCPPPLSLKYCGAERFISHHWRWSPPPPVYSPIVHNLWKFCSPIFTLYAASLISVSYLADGLWTTLLQTSDCYLSLCLRVREDGSMIHLLQNRVTDKPILVEESSFSSWFLAFGPHITHRRDRSYRLRINILYNLQQIKVNS